MELPVEVSRITNTTEAVTLWDGKRLAQIRHNPLSTYFYNAIDAMGQGSKSAQGINAVLTSVARLSENPTHRLYVYATERHIIGILKVGPKKLFIRTKTGHLHEMDPLCVLDFYVHESQQRHGCGSALFSALLASEQVDPRKLGYDRPSAKLLGFLRKHFGLVDYVPQSNNFVVFNSYFEHAPPQPAAAAAPSAAALATSSSAGVGPRGLLRAPDGAAGPNSASAAAATTTRFAAAAGPGFRPAEEPLTRGSSMIVGRSSGADSFYGGVAASVGGNGNGNGGGPHAANSAMVDQRPINRHGAYRPLPQTHVRPFASGYDDMSPTLGTKLSAAQLQRSGVLPSLQSTEAPSQSSVSMNQAGQRGRSTASPPATGASALPVPSTTSHRELVAARSGLVNSAPTTGLSSSCYPGRGAAQGSAMQSDKEQQQQSSLQQLPRPEARAGRRERSPPRGSAGPEGGPGAAPLYALSSTAPRAAPAATVGPVEMAAAARFGLVSTAQERPFGRRTTRV